MFVYSRFAILELYFPEEVGHKDDLSTNMSFFIIDAQRSLWIFTSAFDKVRIEVLTMTIFDLAGGCLLELLPADQSSLYLAVAPFLANWMLQAQNLLHTQG